LTSSADDQEFLEAARNIGKKLCQKAFWHDSRCNWIDRSIEDTIAQNGSAVSKALSSEIYEGTSGIALFLSNLYTFGGGKKDPECKATAEAAISQALHRVEDIPREARFGFYSGQTGIAYAAAVVGKDLGNPGLIEGALKVVRQLYKDRPPYDLLDMISGVAGAIPPLVKIYKISGEPSALDLAVNLGDKLLASAVKEPYGWSWDYKASGLQSAMHNLTGFSHGAAGIGYALIELYDAVEKEEYVEAARAAFRYENHWFSAKDDNWPDFRLDEGDMMQYTAAATQPKAEEQPKFVSGWCHGAPGIGISRLRAHQVLGDKEEAYSDDIASCVRTMARVAAGIDASTDYPNFSLCHGLAGIGDILLYAGQVLGNDSLKSLASKIGHYGIEKFVYKNLPWPCDNRVGEMLGLMLGIAGIGNFYLRLASASSKQIIPSPLMPAAF
jgi:lantibiotic modifying enzyme